jgi:hypothetical protein
MADVEKGAPAPPAPSAGAQPDDVAAAAAHPPAAKLRGFAHRVSDEINQNHVDLVLFACCLATGLTDSTMFNGTSWRCTRIPSSAHSPMD